MKFSDKLKYYRKQNNLTQKSLSNLLNVSDKTISSWENDRTFPDMSMLSKISTVFNLSIDDLLMKDHYVDNNDSDKNNQHWLKYKGILIFFNILIISLAYFELTEFFNFHFPVLNIFILTFILLSLFFIKTYGIPFFEKNNMILLFLLIASNFLLSNLCTNFTHVLNDNNESYIKGFIVGRFLLIFITSIIIVFEKIIILTTFNKK